MTEKIIPIIMAGGEGKRFEGKDHKLLTKIGKYKTIEYVLTIANKINKMNFCITSSHIDKYIKEKYPNTNRLLQKKSLGTANALSLIKNKIDNKKNVIILYGDMPLLKYTTLKKMIMEFNKRKNPLLLYFKSKKELDFGIVHFKNNKIEKIVEHKNLSDSFSKKKINKIKNYNGGVIIINYRILKKLLREIKFDKKYNQKLLTDILQISFNKHIFFEGFFTKKNNEMLGLNTKHDFEEIIKNI